MNEVVGLGWRLHPGDREHLPCRDPGYGTQIRAKTA